MSVWRDETDFLKDIESLSEFYISGNHNEPSKKFVFKSKKTQSPQTKSTLWYESDSEEELNYGFGRGRVNGNGVAKPGNEVNHLDIMRNIQMEVRSVVGNRYNNDVLESFYNICKEESPDVWDVPNIAPKEISISYTKELQERKTSPGNEQVKKSSIADRIETSAAAVGSSAPPEGSSTSSPCKKENRSRTRRQRHNMAANIPSPPFCTTRPANNNGFNVTSKQDFPPLN